MNNPLILRVKATIELTIKMLPLCLMLVISNYLFYSELKRIIDLTAFHKREIYGIRRIRQWGTRNCSLAGVRDYGFIMQSEKK